MKAILCAFVSTLILLLNPTSVMAEDSAITLSESTSVYPVREKLLTLKETHDQNPEKLLNSIRYNSDNFAESTKPGRHAYWHKLTLRGSFKDQQPKPFHLVFETHNLRHLSIYLFENNQLIKSSGLGLINNSHSRKPYQGPVFSFNIKAGDELTLLIRKQNEGPLLAPFTIYDEPSFTEHTNFTFFYWGIAIALLVVLALYNTFVYALNPGKTYFWYLVFHSITFVYFSGLHGFGFLIWPHSFQLFIAQNIMPMNVILIWVAAQFAQTFLNAKVHTPSFYRYLKWFHVITPIALILTIILPEYLTIPPFTIYQAAASIFLMSMAFSAWNNGFRPARYFILSWMMVLIGAAIGIATFVHLIPLTTFGLHAFFIGSVAELLLLSVALADRLRYAEKKAITKAYIDPQRKLPNYSFFINEFSSQINPLLENEKSLAMVIVDTLNYQKLVGLLGPNLLEPIYREHIKRLKKLLQSKHWSVKFKHPSGKDEFFITLPGDQLLFLIKPGENLSTKLETLLQVCSEPVTVKDFEVSLDINIGASIVTAEQVSPLDNYRKVQIALLNKPDNKNSWNIYSPEADQQLKKQTHLLYNIKQAIADRDFDIRLQPQFDLYTQQAIGCEVLIRWKHEQEGIMSPSSFIEVAEQMGIISQITQQVIDQTFHWLSVQSNIPPKFIVSINLSTQDLYDVDFIDFINEQLAAYQVAPENICFEITESTVMKNAIQSLNTISKLQSMGFHIAIDDFGTGYSSLAYLQKIQADKVKIDLTFIRNIHISKTNKAITQTIIRLAQAINAETIAEGIESADELMAIKQLNCQYGQGEFWSKPLSTDKFSERYFSNINKERHTTNEHQDTSLI